MTDKLREAGVVNTHDLLKRFGTPGVDDVAVVYYPAEDRGPCARASVYSPSHETDPDAAWYDYKQKTFVGLRAKSVPRARAWASERYRVAEWAPCPTGRGAWVPAHLRRRALDAVKSQRRG